MDTKRILELQVMLGRTPEGRNIGEAVLEKITAILDSGEDPKSLTRCKLCGLQLDTNAFANGCPNCGCKDVEDFKSERI
jgi:rubrerythrin